MLKTLCLAFFVLAGATSAQARNADAVDAAARIQLAAANAPGDLVSDAYLAPMIGLTLEAHEESGELDPGLRDALVQAREEMTQRVAAGANDEPAALLATASCLSSGADAEGCNQSRARLAELAGENGYHHFVLMTLAAKRGDDEAFRRHGQAVLGAPEFVPDMIPVFRSLYARYREVPKAMWQQAGNYDGPESAPGVLAMAVGAAVVLPGYQPFVQGCDEAHPERRELCVGVARRMVELSPIVMDRLIGLAVINKIGTPAEQDQALESEREAKWLMASALHFERALDDAKMGEYFDIFASQGEFAAMRFANKAAGRPMEPPANWQP